MKGLFLSVKEQKLGGKTKIKIQRNKNSYVVSLGLMLFIYTIGPEKANIWILFFFSNIKSMIGFKEDCKKKKEKEKK